MHARRSVLNMLLVAGALSLAAPSFAYAQPAGGPAVADSKDKGKKKTDKKKKGKKGKKGSTASGDDAEGGDSSTAPAKVDTTVDEGTPDSESGNPSVVIAPGPTASGPGVVDTGGTGGGPTDVGGDPGGGGPVVVVPPVVPPPPVSPMT